MGGHRRILSGRLGPARWLLLCTLRTLRTLRTVDVRRRRAAWDEKGHDEAHGGDPREHQVDRLQAVEQAGSEGRERSGEVLARRAGSSRLFGLTPGPTRAPDGR